MKYLLFFILVNINQINAQELSTVDILEIDIIINEINQNAIEKNFNYFREYWGNAYSYSKSAINNKSFLNSLRNEYNQPEMSDSEILEHVNIMAYTRRLNEIIKRNIPETYRDNINYQNEIIKISYPWDGSYLIIEIKKKKNWYLSDIWVHYRF